MKWNRINTTWNTRIVTSKIKHNLNTMTLYCEKCKTNVDTFYYQRYKVKETPMYRVLCEGCYNSMWFDSSFTDDEVDKSIEEERWF